MMQKKASLLFMLALSLGASALFCMGAPALAQSTTAVEPLPVSENAQTLAMELPAQEQAKKFSLLLGLTKSANMYKEGTYEREEYTELLLNPSYVISDLTTFSAKAVATQEDFGPRNSTFSNTTLSLIRKGTEFDDLKLFYTLAGVLPTDRTEYKKSRLQGVLGAGIGVKGESGRLKGSFALALTRNFHEFTQNSEGSPLVQHSLSQTLGLDYELNEKWSLSTVGIYKMGRTYKDFERQTYALEAAVNYSITDSFQASLGLSNESKALRADGTATDIRLYNQNTSVVSAGITFVN